jgi:uncharacterized RDD family membrane protein YckC
MAEDDLAKSDSNLPSSGLPEPAAPATAPGGSDESAAETAEASQRLPPAQALPPFRGFTSLPPQTFAGTGSQFGAPDSGQPTPEIPGDIPGAGGGAYSPPNVPPAWPMGYPGAGSVAPSYPLGPGYGAPYGSPPYGSPPYSPPPFGAPPYGQPPGYLPYAPPSYPGSSWTPPPPGSWGAGGSYPPPGWGYRPGYPLAAYAPPGPGPGLQWGGVGQRFGALVIDAVILLCGLFAVGLLVTAVDGGGSSSRVDTTAGTAIALMWWLFALIYHPACWYVFGATPGQKALGLRVAQASNGQSLGLGAVLVRYLVFFIVTVIFPLGLVSAVMTSNDPFKRAWHDDVARSVVVRH